MTQTIAASVTDIRFRRAEEHPILAYAELAFGVEGIGRFLCRTVKVMVQPNGELRLGFPSSPESHSCPRCRGRVIDSARFCGGCGLTQPAPADGTLRREEFHPTDGETRRRVTDLVLAAYHEWRATLGSQAG